MRTIRCIVAFAVLGGVVAHGAEKRIQTPRIIHEPSLTYDERGDFDVPDLGAGSLLVNRDNGKLVVRYDFVHGTLPVLDGTKQVSIVVGPRDNWTATSPTLEKKSTAPRGDAAYATFSNKELSQAFGNAPLATYAKVIDKEGTHYINQGNKIGQRFSLEADGSR